MVPEASLPCPQCVQKTAPGHETCPHCGASLLVDVILGEPVEDPRARFALAKSLLALGGSIGPFGELQAGLKEPGFCIARGVTHAFARRCIEVLTDAGIQGARIIPRAAFPAAKSGPRRIWGLILVLLLGLAVLMTRAGVAKRLPIREAPRQTSSDPPPEMEIARETLNKVIASTVAIHCLHSEGAGFFVTEHRVLAHAHALCPRDEPMRVVLPNGRTLLGTARSRDDVLDLAVIDVAGDSGEPLPLGDAATLHLGDKVAAVGRPKGFEFTAHTGAVSYIGRNYSGVGYVQVDINVTPDNSGGPLVDKSGRVVGVMSMEVKGSKGLGLALPINYAIYGPHPMLEPSEHPPASAAWATLLSQVAKQEAREVEEAHRAPDSVDPGLGLSARQEEQAQQEEQARQAAQALQEERSRQEEAEQEKRAEAMWRGRFRRARQQIESVEERIRNAERFVKAADGVATAGRRLNATGASQYEAAKAQLERADADRAKAREQLEELERQASREGIPFEWRK